MPKFRDANLEPQQCHLLIKWHWVNYFSGHLPLYFTFSNHIWAHIKCSVSVDYCSTTAQTHCDYWHRLWVRDQALSIRSNPLNLRRLLRESCRRLLRVSWTARSKQSLLKEINPNYSLEGWMLKLKLQYFGHLMQRADSLEKTLMLVKTEGKRRSGWQRMTWLDGITDVIDTSQSKFWELVMARDARGPEVHGEAKSQTRLNWTDANVKNIAYST